VHSLFARCTDLCAVLLAVLARVLFFTRNVRDDEIPVLQTQLQHSIDRIFQRKKHHLASMHAHRRAGAPQMRKSTPGLMSRARELFFGQKPDAHGQVAAQSASTLQHETHVLEEVSRELFLELDGLYVAKERQERSKQLKGRLFNVLGYFVSAYCVYKLVMVGLFACASLLSASLPMFLRCF
jgi:hypothetical protein